MTTSACDKLICITLGEKTYAYDLTFLVSFVLAVLVVFIFSVSKFGETTIERKDGDFISQLLPKYLATPEEYSRALIYYVTTMVAIVVVLSVAGPGIVSLGSTGVPDAPSALPMFAALVLVGVLPNVPWLQELERLLRRLFHERAYIPKAARATAEQLAAVEFDFTAYKNDDVINSPLMRGVELTDFGRPRNSIEYSWARLSCLLYQLRQLQAADLTAGLDAELLEQYANDLDNITLRRRTMVDDIGRYRQERTNNRFYADDDLHEAIKKALRQLYVLLGCAVRLKLSTDAQINPALQSFGFKLGSVVDNPQNKNIMIVGLAAMTAAVFGVAYVAFGLRLLFAHNSWWTPSNYFIQNAYEPFIFAMSAVLVHGAAIFVADRMRARRLGRNRWFAQTGARRRSIMANYIRVAIGCATAGFLVLYVLGVLFERNLVGPAMAAAVYSLLPAATGAFYAYHLDNVELGQRPSWKSEISLQALVTGFCALAGILAWFGWKSEAGSPVLDQTLLVTVIGLVIGAALAWCIPKAASQDKFDPLTAARDSRIAALREQAVHSLGSAEAADRWLDEPNPRLDNQSPRNVAADVGRFENALSLLQGPHLAFSGVAA